MTTNLNNIRTAQFAGNAIQIVSEDGGLLRTIDRHFKHCLGVEENLAARYQVRAGEEARFSILKDGAEFQSDLRLEQVLFQLMQDGLTELNGAARSHLIFHAAALAHEDNGVLLCGKSGSGKSTLAGWLAVKGFQYLTDEVIAYSLIGGEVRGFPRSLVLKRGSSAIWEGWLSAAHEDHYLKMEDGSVWIAPTLLNPSAIREQVTPRLVIFPTYSADAAFSVEKLTSAGTLFHLLQCLVNARNFEDHGLTATKHLSQSATAYRLIYSDIEQAEEWIRKTLTA